MSYVSIYCTSKCLILAEDICQTIGSRNNSAVYLLIEERLMIHLGLWPPRFQRYFLPLSQAPIHIYNPYPQNLSQASLHQCLPFQLTHLSIYIPKYLTLLGMAILWFYHIFFPINNFPLTNDYSSLGGYTQAQVCLPSQEYVNILNLNSEEHHRIFLDLYKIEKRWMLLIKKEKGSLEYAGADYNQSHNLPRGDRESLRQHQV